jgi:hypothetical protein
LLRSGERPRAPRARVGAPILVPLALATAAALALWFGRGRLAAIGSQVLESPDAQVRKALLHQDRARLDDVYGFRAGGTAELAPVRFGDVAIGFDGEKALVTARVEAQGRVAWRDETAALSYLGLERFTMTACPIALWCADGRQFSNLRAVLTALFRRLDAFNARDPDAYARLVSDGYQGPGGKPALLAQLRKDLPAGPPAVLRARAWQIRVERERAIVGEDYEVRVGGGDPARLRARFELAREGDRWAFVGGL